MPLLYHNPAACSYVIETTPDPAVPAFHASLPGFAPTALTALPTLAASLGLSQLLLKDETSRLSLPSFKILGASWGAHRAVCALHGLPASTAPTDLPRLPQLTLVAATDGNHGRAVARVATLMGHAARIVVPPYVDAATRALIAAEGAEVVETPGSYDDAVQAAAAFSDSNAAGGEGGQRVLVQDTAWAGYETVPQWIVSGYSTLLHELDSQLPPGTTLDLLVVPVGVGSLAQAAVEHYRAHTRPAGARPRILAVEPAAAACLGASLHAGEPTPVPAVDTIMTGLCCGTVSSLAWPRLCAGVDAAVAVTDVQAHHAVAELGEVGVRAGPCGAAALAGLRVALAEERLELGPRSTVVLLCTEGEREYVVPV